MLKHAGTLLTRNPRLFLSRASIFAICGMYLTGCVNSASVRSVEINTEQAIIKRNGEIKTAKQKKYEGSADLQETDISYSFAGRINYANMLSTVYMDQAAIASQNEEFAAYGIIGAAAVASGGLLYGAHTDVLKGAGLAAGTISATRGYAKPGEAAEHLLDAAEGLLCIVNVSRNVSVQGKESEAKITEAQPEVAAIVDDGINRIRLNLRKKLLRQAPEYSTLLNDIKKGSGSPTFVSADDFKAAISNCVLRSSLPG